MSSARPTPATQQILENLREEIRRRQGPRPPDDEVLISSGHRALDRLLPERGFRRGTIVEWLSAGRGSGAASLALLAARQATAEGGALVVVDRWRRFYPPAAVQLGIALEQLFIVRPTSDELCAWAWDQILRSPGVAAAWGWSAEQDNHAYRRWQLAAESSGALGLIVRPWRGRQAAAWAELRLGVAPLPRLRGDTGLDRRLRVELLRSRVGASGQAIELELPLPGGAKQAASLARSATGESHSLRLDSALAAAKTGRRSRRA